MDLGSEVIFFLFGMNKFFRSPFPMNKVSLELRRTGEETALSALTRVRLEPSSSSKFVCIDEGRKGVVKKRIFG